MEDTAWPIETIPDEHCLFMRVHYTQMRDGQPYPHAFKNQPTEHDGMSTDWCHYRKNPKDTREGARAGQPATNYAVIKLPVEKIRKIPSQIVEHKPIPKNRSHSEVAGPKKSTEIRERFMQIYQMVVPLES